MAYVTGKFINRSRINAAELVLFNSLASKRYGFVFVHICLPLFLLILKMAFFHVFSKAPQLLLRLHNALSTSKESLSEACSKKEAENSFPRRQSVTSLY